jgi:hypothetical protein
MPITLGKLHLTFHRGTLLTDKQDNAVVKKLTGQPKDDLPRRLNHWPELIPRAKPRGLLPSLTIKQTTDSTRFTSSRSLDRAIQDRCLEVDNPPEIIGAVQRHIDQHLLVRSRKPTSQQLPLLVLVGESHDSNASLIMRLAVAARFANQGGTLLLERTSAEVDLIKGAAQALARAFSGHDIDRRHQNARIEQAMQPGAPLATRQTYNEALATLLAAQSGIDVGHLDSVRGHLAKAPGVDQEVREMSMVQDIKEGVGSTEGPVLACVGSLHLPRLMRELEGTFDVMAISFVTPHFNEVFASEYRKRNSFVLSNDKILKLRAGPNIDSLPFQTTALFNQLNVDVRTPLPGPIPLGSPWER